MFQLSSYLPIPSKAPNEGYRSSKKSKFMLKCRIHVEKVQTRIHWILALPQVVLPFEYLIWRSQTKVDLQGGHGIGLLYRCPSHNPQNLHCISTKGWPILGYVPRVDTRFRPSLFRQFCMVWWQGRTDSRSLSRTSNQLSPRQQIWRMRSTSTFLHRRNLTW